MITAIFSDGLRIYCQCEEERLKILGTLGPDRNLAAYIIDPQAEEQVSLVKPNNQTESSKHHEYNTMSKKHFIALADMIRDHNQTIVAVDRFSDEHLATFCQRQNPLFKRDRWLAYVSGECGKNGGSK